MSTAKLEGGFAFLTNETEVYEREQDALGWSEYAERLALLLALPGRPTPLTLGIQGDWGSGKTSFINLVLAHLGSGPERVEQQQDNQLARYLEIYKHPIDGAPATYAGFPPVLVYLLRFDSWIFTQSDLPVDYLFPIFINQVLSDYLRSTHSVPDDSPALQNASVLGRVLPKLSSGALAAGGSVMGGLLGGPAGVGVGALTGLTATGLELLTHKGNSATSLLSDILPNIVGFKYNFQWLVDRILKPSTEQAEMLAQIGDTHYNRLIVVVDDLDRIPALMAVNITEKIKLLMDVPGCIFVLAADLHVIREGLREKLGGDVTKEEGKNYLDKIIHLQYRVPAIPQDKVPEFARNYDRWATSFRINAYSASAEILLTFFPTIAGNPRNLKRTLSNFSFSLDLRYGLEVETDPHLALRVLALTIINQYHAEAANGFYAWLSSQPDSSQLLDAKRRESGDTDLIAELRKYGDLRSPLLEQYFDYITTLGYTIEEWLAAFMLSKVASPNIA